VQQHSRGKVKSYYSNIIQDELLKQEKISQNVWCHA